MELIPFVLVVASAFFHALWNLLAKGGADKVAFMWLMNLTALLTALPLFLLLMSDWGFPLAAAPYMVISSLAEALYFFSLGRAYEHGDLSLVYPIARSSLLFLFPMAVAFLGEEASHLGAIGILLVVLGVYMIHLRGLSPGDLLAPIASMKSRASQFALLAALSSATYSLIDKVGVLRAGPVKYAFWLDFFITASLAPIVLWRGGLSSLASEWRSQNLRIITSGFLMRAGYLMVLVAMSMAQVSYIIGVRQLSIVIGSILGAGLLRERYWKVRTIASIIIFSGILILGTMV